MKMAYCGGFWATLDLLVSTGGINDSTPQPFADDIEDWLDDVSNKVKLLSHLSEEAAEEEEASQKDENGIKSLEYQTLIECNITHPLVKSRLELLMGSNVVRLTDRKYMLKLMSRIRQDHEAKQKIRIEERMKQESNRTKTMILNRLIPVQEAPEDIRQYPLFQLYLYCDAIGEAKCKKRTKTSIRMRESLYQMLYPVKKDTDETEDDEEEYIYMKKSRNNGEVQMIPLSNTEISVLLRDREEEKDIENGYILTQEEFDRLHYEADAVKNLREAQTVEEMYAKAHAIVGILYSHVDEGRYKKPETIAENKEETTQGEEDEDKEKVD